MDILQNAELRPAIRQQAEAFLGIHAHAPLLASVFATQQRYMMGQIFLSLTYKSSDGRVLLAEFLRKVEQFRIASPNTAEAFVREMVREGIGIPAPERKDRRSRPLMVAEAAHVMMRRWMAIHLHTLDRLDGGARAATLSTQPDLLPILQPRVVDGILQSDVCIRPSGTFALFSWLNDGGLLMDRLIAGLTDTRERASQVATALSSYTQLRTGLAISRSHLTRKLHAAEAAGSLGWTGARGRSTLWVSRGFIAEYDAYQAEKLAIVANSFAATGTGI
ncbi:hypothetical protein GCM10007301_14780 [Azorhizobium oxalatiphilum]|uniref:Uncharacterized protein n=1 Tax=Azorhizobium oxalatiphilum TaxID=980631 RepID=A0A917F9V4_9HYPH|nr:hypothetical protein GCM10007301_14780 [Azorhizobium oxalatiphilum]